MDIDEKLFIIESMAKHAKDRRTERTRRLLQEALAELADERGYDAVTIADITERANVGRTTFYLHYHSKDDLFLNSLEQHVIDFGFGMKSASDWLNDKPTPQLLGFFREGKRRGEARRRMNDVQDNLIRQAMNRIISQNMGANLRAAFPNSTFTVPLPLLAQAMAGTHIWLLDCFLERGFAYTAEEVAETSQRMMRAMLLEALVRGDNNPEAV